MRKLYILLILLYTVNLYSEDKLLISSEDYSGLKLKVELANPKIYKQNDEIFIKVNIYNPENSEKSSFISIDKKYSFDIDLVNMQNRVVDRNKDYYISFHKTQPVFYNIIKLNSDEGFTYTLRLNDYYDLDISGQFFLKVFYYPNLKKGSENDATIVSNQLTINVRPSDIEEDYIVELKSLEDEKKLFAEKKSPDEVVKYVLDARMKGEWEKFFLYIELEKLIQWNNIFNSRYKKADIERKKEILTEYKEYLKQNSIDEISYLPHGYKIMRTEYTEGKAKVETIVEYKYLDYIEKKYYTYFLFKKGSVWYIESYEVMNIGAKE